MTEAEARSRLESMVASATEPVLSQAEVDKLVVLAKRTADDGTVLWLLPLAAAEGWRWKAGKVVGNFDFGSDGQRFDRSEVYRACLEMAKRYARGVGTSVLVGISTNGCEYVVGNRAE